MADSFLSLLGDCLTEDSSQENLSIPEPRPTGTEKHELPKGHSDQSAPVTPASVGNPLAVLDFGFPVGKTAGAFFDAVPHDAAEQTKELSRATPADMAREPLPESAPVDTVRHDVTRPELAFAAKLVANAPAGEGETDPAASPAISPTEVPSDPVPPVAVASPAAPSPQATPLASTGTPPTTDAQGSSGNGKPVVDAQFQPPDNSSVRASASPNNDSADTQPAIQPAKSQSAVPDEDRPARPEDIQTEFASGTGVPVSAGFHADRQDAPANTASAREASAARPAEPEVQPPAPAPVSHGVSLRLGDGPNSVDIRMAERAGEIRVTVHTPDHDMANSLRGELPDLVGKLRQNGFQVETWRPAAPGQADSGRRQGGDSSTLDQQGGGRKDGRSPQHQQKERNQSNWAGEWQSTLGPSQESNI